MVAVSNNTLPNTLPKVLLLWTMVLLGDSVPWESPGTEKPPNNPLPLKWTAEGGWVQSTAVAQVEA